MASTAKLVLKPFLANWLDQLDSCFAGERSLVRLATPNQTGWLYRLVQANHSPVMGRSAALEYLGTLAAAEQEVPRERKEFPVGYSWDVIKKWDRWKGLRVISRIERYVDALPAWWEGFCRKRELISSPFFRLCIHRQNMADAYSFLNLNLTDAIRADLDRQFPAVGVMKRIQRGGLPAPSDIEVLEPLVKSRCGLQAFGARKKLVLCLKKLKARADMGRQVAQAEFEEITLASDSQYALLLAYDIQAQQKRELADVVVCDWNGECGLRTSGFLRCLGNASYIKALREIMPLPRVGDPVLERRIRAKHLRSARDLRKKAAVAYGIATKNVQPGDGGHSELEWLEENPPQE